MTEGNKEALVMPALCRLRERNMVDGKHTPCQKPPTLFDTKASQYKYLSKLTRLTQPSQSYRFVMRGCHQMTSCFLHGHSNGILVGRFVVVVVIFRVKRQSKPVGIRSTSGRRTLFFGQFFHHTLHIRIHIHIQKSRAEPGKDSPYMYACMHEWTYDMDECKSE
jgi:hypothetical protein